MFAGEIIDPAEDRYVRTDLILGGEVHEVVVLNITIRSKEIWVNFFARVDPLRFDCRSYLLAPKIGCRNVNLVARSPRQARPLRRANVSRRSFLRFQISVARSEIEIGDGRRA